MATNLSFAPSIMFSQTRVLKPSRGGVSNRPCIRFGGNANT